MPRQKKFKDRINDLRIHYGSTKDLADSLGVSERTIYNWLKRDDPPENLDRTLEERTGNSRAIKDREYYFNVQKPREEFRKKREMEPFAVQPGQILERSIEAFSNLEFQQAVDDAARDKIASNRAYQVDFNIRNFDDLTQWDLSRTLKGSQIINRDQFESVLWNILGKAYELEGTSNLGIFLTSIQIK